MKQDECFAFLILQSCHGTVQWFYKTKVSNGLDTICCELDSYWNNCLVDLLANSYSDVTKKSYSTCLVTRWRSFYTILFSLGFRIRPTWSNEKLHQLCIAITITINPIIVHLNVRSCMTKIGVICLKFATRINSIINKINIQI